MENTRFATTNTASMTTTTATTIKRKKENEKNFYTSKLINCEEIVARDATMFYGKEEEIFFEFNSLPFYHNGWDSYKFVRQ